MPVSALKGEGIDALLDMVILTAEMENLKANPNREAVGTVIEAHLDHSLGPVATILVNTGTLRVPDNFIVGDTYGRVKLMRDHNGKAVKEAEPSRPVFVAGFDKTPKSGDVLQVVASEKIAREKAEEISLINKAEAVEHMSASNLLISHIRSEQILKLIIKADMKGSLEAIKQSVAKIKDEEVAVKIIHSGVGRINDSDIMMASASKALVVGFHSDFDSPNVLKLAEREGVEVKFYKVIYDLLEDVKKYLSGLLEAEIVEVVLGRAEVRQIFLTKKNKVILGARVNGGKIENKAKVRVIRGRNAEDEDNVVGNGVIDSLRKGDDVVAEMKEGNECGIQFIGDITPEPGDILLAYKEEKRERTVS